MSKRRYHCQNCKTETEQFIQFSMAFLDKDSQTWFCERCYKEVSPMTSEEKEQQIDFLKTRALDNLMHIVCEYYQTQPQVLRSDSKKEGAVRAKHAFNYMASVLNYGNTRKIGKYLGVDHTRVYKSCNRMKDWMSYCNRTRSDINALTNLVMHTDKLQVFKNILTKTPPERMAQLIQEIENLTLEQP